MSDWNEQTLRKAASWKAFKEGEALLRDGCVTAAAASSGGWRGTVRAGRKAMRVSVTVKSATDMETRCPCPDNQASGALCGHAVATGLALLRRPQETSHVTKETSPPPMAGPCNLVLGPRWLDALARGKMAVSIVPAPRGDLHDADLRLHAQLTAAGLVPDKETRLHLGGAQLAGFLTTIAGHPGVSAQDDGSPVEITDGHRLPLAEVLREGDEVRLVADADAGPWQLIGDSLVRAGSDFIHLAGDGAVPESLRPVIDALVSGKRSARIPLRELLGQLPSWQDWLEFPGHGWLAGLHFVPATPRIHLALDGSLRELGARLTVAYPDAEPLPPGTGSVPSLPRLRDGICELRDLETEAAIRGKLEDAGFVAANPVTGAWKLTGESAILPFLVKELPGLRRRWIIDESPALKRALVRIIIASPKIDVLASGDDWLHFDLQYQTQDGRVLPAGEIRSLLRSGNRHRKLSGDRHLWVDENSAGVIESLIGESDIRQENGHYTATRCAAELIMNFSKNSWDKQNINLYETFSDFKKPALIQAELRPYQNHGCAWLADRLQRYGGALLADDMGLGKTIQAIALIESIHESAGAGEGPVLVVATTSLLGNWQAEFARFAPARKVIVLHGTSRESVRKSARAGDVLITSYGTLARDLAWHLRQHYRVVVADEASLMRNPETDHARALAKLHSDYRIALTGTPIENGVRDLWSIFRFIQPGWLGDRAAFRERYELPLGQPDPPAGLLRTLRLKTSPFILRRTKREVAPELPGKLEIDEFCDLSRDQSAVYREILNEGRRQVESLTDARLDAAARMRMLTILLRLRQTCCDLALLQNDRFNQLPRARRSAKLERLMELLEVAISGNHRVLIFSQFRMQLLEVEKCVAEAGMSRLRLDGQTRNRQELVNRFQDPAGPDVFLISLKAGGYGLNLTAADTVIHFDPWWNPAAEAQATDRAHRIGQTRPVTVYRLLTRGTVEEKVLRMQERKRELARVIDEAGGGEAPAGWLNDPKRLRELFEA